MKVQHVPFGRSLATAQPDTPVDPRAETLCSRIGNTTLMPEVAHRTLVEKHIASIDESIQVCQTGVLDMFQACNLLKQVCAMHS
jgi:hypothetical protein